tara:strand:+ start:4055 stop:5257 length:1203 start_codon:yes stop_codon:yes gene_type:complete
MNKLLNNIQGWVHNGASGNDLQMADYASGTHTGTTYSGRQFKVYIAPDSGVGTINSSTNGGDAFRLDIEGVTLPEFSPNQEFEMRSGAGRIAEFGAMFSSSKRTVTEFTLSGRVTLQDLPVLMENVLAQADSTNLFEVATGYAPANIEHGAATGGTVFSKTLTVWFVPPTAADTYTLPGCVCTALTLDADMGTAGGRYNYTATFQTGYIPTKGADNLENAAELTTTLGSTNVFLSDQQTKDMNIMEIDGSGTDHTSINPILSTVSLSIESPTVFLGAQGTNAEPEVVSRAVPELNITLSGTMKYDTSTDKLIEAFRDPAQSSYIQLALNNRALSNGDGQPFASNIAIAAHAEQLFGFIIEKAKLTSCSVTSDDVAMVSFDMKVLDQGTNETIHIATGATA